MTDELKRLADGCRIKAEIYAKEAPEIPASFIWVADEIERLSRALAVTNGERASG